VADAIPPAAQAALDDPFAQLTGSLAGTSRLQLAVAESTRLTPHLQQLVLSSPGLRDFRYRPGQDLMLLVAADGSRPIRRRYTIRRLNPARGLVTLHVVLHGDGPGERWVLGARPGQLIEAIGPRGKITTSPSSDWHLFMGDESALAAILAMTESLPGDATATLIIEIAEPADELEVLAPARTRVSWLHRLGRPAGDLQLLTAESADVELPPGDGHAYLLGEARVVSALRDVLARRGLPPEQVSAKAYWGRGRANEGHGEPARS
jgi:NADPH-dependent ferric siderophore reductase